MGESPTPNGMQKRWLVLGGLALWGCGDTEANPAICDEAAAVLSECLDADVAAPATCDAAAQAEAEIVVARGCDGLDPGKADDFNPDGPYDGDLASGAQPGDPGYFEEVLGGDALRTDEAPAYMEAVEGEFFERSADKVNEIQDFVSCDAAGGDWEEAACLDDDGDEIALPVYDFRLPTPTPEQASGSREVKCEQQGGRWVPGACSTASDVSVQRGFHNKGHLCTRAGFKVFSDAEMETMLPEEQHDLIRDVRVGGVFGEEGRVFGSWVRLSNGHPARQDDALPDFRGFAVKLLGVEGRQVLEGDEGFSAGETQDFLMLSNPMMAAPDAHTFMHFVDHGGPPNGTLAAGLYVKRLAAPMRILGIRVNQFQDEPEFAEHMLTGSKVLQHMAHFLKHRVFLSDPIGFLRSRPKSLEGQPFFSGSAIRFGDETIARYSVVPCTNAAPSLSCTESDTRQRSEGELREPLEERLSGGALGDDGKGLRYRFFVQLQNPDGGTPLENASNEWSADESLPIPVADVIIPPRPTDYASDAAESEAFCETLRFMPFHAVEAYEPVGSINRIRKFVYRASQNKRDGRIEEESADVCFGFDCDVVDIVAGYGG